MPVSQVHQLTSEVVQTEADPSEFQVDGRDKSWFVQKGALSFKCDDSSKFRLSLVFTGGVLNRFGDCYADLPRASQEQTINWLLMLGATATDYELNGETDCKSGNGLFFLLHLDYRRTKWRISACPHNATLRDVEGSSYSSDPQSDELLEMKAYENQMIRVELRAGKLWLMDGDTYVAEAAWPSTAADDAAAAAGTAAGEISKLALRPAILTSNCPTAFRAVVDDLSSCEPGCHSSYIVLAPPVLCCRRRGCARSTPTWSCRPLTRVARSFGFPRPRPPTSDPYDNGQRRRFRSALSLKGNVDRFLRCESACIEGKR
eukprot:TRINITY_DN19996_c0_g4_i2.p1 TRINITY_DN19996_c0_g4~~TRINITY_DN19996_c0_g4_i2.p1  ORF type:complete len:317 (+),score=52.35 TRINITY_DN19996_c0_g4_i2:231-1181(+)